MVKIFDKKTIVVVACAFAMYACDEAASEKSVARAVLCAAAAACLGPAIADYSDKAIKAGAPAVREAVKKVRDYVYKP